jgi:serine protease Do
MSNHHAGLRNKALTSVAAIALVATGAVGVAVFESGRPALAQSAPLTVEAQTAPATFADVVDRVKPAVVSVKVTGKKADADGERSGSRLDNVPPQMREFFRRFGEGGAPQAPRGGGQAVGSGFFVSADGYVVTNNHVIESGRVVSVVTDDGRTLDTKVIGSDPKTDIALLKVTEGGDFPYVKLATTVPRVGDWVVAIGNPFGLGGTVTSGIVSARGRDIGAGPYDDFLQIDASINRGNSGGPTFNLRGEVVGVNTAIASPSGGSVGLAFAIPAATVGSVVAQLQSEGRVTRGFIGVQVQPLTKDLAEGLGLSRDKGALVNSAQPGTPAAKAGLRSGDVILSVDGSPIADARELTRRIGALRPGASVELTYLRDGREQRAKLELGSLPNQEQASLDRTPDRSATSSLRLGLQLAPAPGEEGVVVTTVDPDGPAASKGIREGDIIVDVAGQAVTTPNDVVAGVRTARESGRKVVLMRVKNREGTRFVALSLAGNNPG